MDKPNITSFLMMLALLLTTPIAAIGQQEQLLEELTQETGSELTLFHAESRSGPDDISQSPAYTTVLTKDLPSGRYVINSKVVVSDTEDADSFPATVRCTIFNGSSVVDSYALQMGTSESGINTRVFTLQGVANVSGDSAELSLRCRKGSNDTTQISVRENPKLTAIRVGDIEIHDEEDAVSLTNEDCLPVDSQNLSVQSNGDRFLVTDGRSRMMLFDTRDAARLAIEVIRHYELDNQCFAIRPDAGLRYFKTGDDIPTGGFPGEDCIAISNPQNLAIRESSPSLFQILDGRSIPYRAKSREEAERIIEIIQHYEAGFTCYIERPDPGMIYLRR